MREEELKNKVWQDFFSQFDHTEILWNIDFTVFPKQTTLLDQTELFWRAPLLWAEAKTWDYDLVTMFVQLILTIGKARTFNKTLPPTFLWAFDFKKIAFIRYVHIEDIFQMNDFNWNVTPSNHATKEFQLIQHRIEESLQKRVYSFNYEKDEKVLQAFIKNNVAKESTKSKIKIDKNNFVPIYLRWLEAVKPIIDINWDNIKKENIFDSDFYLADLFVDDKNTQTIEDDRSVLESLFVVYQNQGYKIKKEDIKQMFDATINIHNKDIYQNFWKIYKRPPIKEFQDYIIERRDLLAPQDIRERKWAYFTPRKWVELSQKYIADTLWENWQDDYYVWDCAAGTWNLLAGLTNKYNIYASTLDQADVNVMHERIDHWAMLVKNHVFQFDFLNDEFIPVSKGWKIPDSLFDIINNPEKRKKLVIYINPPYAEVSSVWEKGKAWVNQSKTHTKYKDILWTAWRELYIQFLIRIYKEIDSAIIAEFSTLKVLQWSAFIKIRQHFKAKLKNMFITPANTFDNVTGQFPIGFKIWDTSKKEAFQSIETDIYDAKGIFIGEKWIYAIDKSQYVNKWISSYKVEDDFIGFLAWTNGNDFQQNNIVYLLNKKGQMANPRWIWISAKNLILTSIYNAIRKVIAANWLNDRDQFLFPSNWWKSDRQFQSDCLAYTLFSNNIQSEFGTNHWIPFTESEVNSQERFESHFMTDFMAGKIKAEEPEENEMFQESETKNYIPAESLVFYPEAQAVFDAGRELWKYYHAESWANPNASFYDIRAHFQGRNAKWRMNPRSTDETYTELIGELRNKLGILAEKIEPKVYEYGFLKV